MTVGPCEPYITAEQIAVSPLVGIAVPITDTAIRARLTEKALEASEVLYVLLGRQYPGTCQATVRPVRTDCGPRFPGPRFSGSGAFYGSWGPPGFGWGYGGGWFGICGCDNPIQLSPYVHSIDAIMVDGVELDDDEWYLNDRMLHRVQASWPRVNHLWLPDTAADTFSITYTFGPETPRLAADAALELAIQYWLQSNQDAACTLPQGTTSVSLQGQTIQIAERIAELRAAGATLPSVAQALGTFNPANQRVPPDLYTDTGWDLVVATPTGS